MQRRKGYLDALEEAALAPDPSLMCQVEFELESAEAEVGRLVRQRKLFDGIVAASDLIALGAIRALRRAGIGGPEDVSVVGYDDMLLSRLSTPALSTIRQDTQRAGQLLVSSVLDSSADDLPTLLPTELIIRESCGA
jgi:DNA-binding LacI/PurR family transcriptional regulator